MPVKSQAKAAPAKKQTKATVQSTTEDVSKKAQKKQPSQAPKPDPKKKTPEKKTQVQKKAAKSTNSKSQSPKNSENPKSNSPSAIKNQKESAKKLAQTSNSNQKFDISDVLEQVLPKKPLTPFIFFSMSRRSHILDFLKDQEQKKQTEISKIIGQMWNSLKDEDKKPFLLLAEQDKKRYEKEMGEQEKLGYFIDQEGIKSTDVMLQNPKFKKHVVLPKKALTPYFLFLIENNPILKKNHPELKITEISKKQSEIWNQFNDKQKKVYEELSLKDKIRYQNQIQEILSKGFFITDKGEKSSDLQKKEKKQQKEKTLTQSTKSGTAIDPSNSQASDDTPAKVGQKRKRVVSAPVEKKSAKVQKSK